MSIASDHVGDSLKYVLILGSTLSDRLQSFLIDKLLELCHLLLVSDSGQAHLRVSVVNGSDVAHVSEIVAVGRDVVKEELEHSAHTFRFQEKFSHLGAELYKSGDNLKVLSAVS